MFSSRVMAHPCPKFKSKFPDLYVEPMQYDNSEEKWQDVSPYMFINLDQERGIYISKDTAIVYAYKEDVTCEYLEINQVIENTKFRNWTTRQVKYY